MLLASTWMTNISTLNQRLLVGELGRGRDVRNRDISPFRVAIKIPGKLLERLKLAVSVGSSIMSIFHLKSPLATFMLILFAI